MKQIQLTLKDEAGELTETITATFDQAEYSLFNTFLALVARVKACSIVLRGIPSIVQIKWELGSNLNLSCEPYTNTELYELLHVLRPVILKREPASFHNITGLLGRRFSNKNFSSFLKTHRRLFEHGELSMYMQISLNNQPLFDESLLNIWLNGSQYHTDADKANSWQTIEKALTTENARALVMNQLQSKLKALIIIENLINIVIKQNEDS